MLKELEVRNKKSTGNTMVNKKAYIELCNEWQKKYSGRLIKDGPVNWERYISSNPKLLWILNEARILQIRMKICIGKTPFLLYNGGNKR
ncbi:MAG: hypothetical protein M1517_00810 [Deltaproteobacteria bacterium]|nr:hypothetical protein [Deltaproteobacteria bacterium]